MQEKEVLKELEDEFADIDRFASISLKDLWDNKDDDEAWSQYLQ